MQLQKFRIFGEKQYVSGFMSSCFLRYRPLLSAVVFDLFAASCKSVLCTSLTNMLYLQDLDPVCYEHLWFLIKILSQLHVFDLNVPCSYSHLYKELVQLQIAFF